MTDSAGNADAVAVDAAVVDSLPKQPSDARRFLGVLVFGLVAIVWYALIRMAVLALFALAWQVMPRTQTGAALWMLFVQPIGLALGAYLTLLTNVRNRPFHTVLTVVVFASVLVGHISWPVGNPFIPHAQDGLRITAYVVQGLFVGIGAAVGFWRTKPKELKVPRMLLPPKARKPA